MWERKRLSDVGGCERQRDGEEQEWLGWRGGVRERESQTDEQERYEGEEIIDDRGRKKREKDASVFSGYRSLLGVY